MHEYRLFHLKVLLPTCQLHKSVTQHVSVTTYLPLEKFYKSLSLIHFFNISGSRHCLLMTISKYAANYFTTSANLIFLF